MGTPITKTLDSGIPTVRSDTQVVITWTIVATYSQPYGEGQTYSVPYTYNWSCEGLGKIPDDFTQQELLDAFPAALETVFTASLEASTTPPANSPEPIPDFDVHTLPEGV